jgi:hypothetical protein
MYNKLVVITILYILCTVGGDSYTYASPSVCEMNGLGWYQ